MSKEIITVNESTELYSDIVQQSSSSGAYPTPTTPEPSSSDLDTPSSTAVKSGNGVIGIESETSDSSDDASNQERYYSTMDYGQAGKKMPGDLGEGAEILYLGFESTAGHVTTMATKAAAQEAMNRYLDSLEKNNISDIINESIGGKIDTNDFFDSTAAANYLQQTGVTVNIDGVDTQFKNELQFMGGDGKTSLLEQLINGDEIELFDSDEGVFKRFDTNKLRVLGSNGQEISIKEYAKRIFNNAYDKNAALRDFERDFNKLALHNTITDSSGAGRAKAAIDEFYGALVAVGMDEGASSHLVAGRNANMNVFIGGGVDLSGVMGIHRPQSHAFRATTINSRDVRREYTGDTMTGGTKTRTKSMRQDSWNYAAKGRSTLERNRVMLKRQLAQYTDYLSQGLTSGQRRELENFLRSGRKSEAQIEAFLKARGVTINETTRRIIGSYVNAENLLNETEKALGSNDREKSAQGRILKKQVEESDYKQGRDKVKKASLYGEKTTKVVWHSSLGAAEYAVKGMGVLENKLIGVNHFNRAGNILRNVRKAPGRKIEKIRDLKSQGRANARALRDRALSNINHRLANTKVGRNRYVRGFSKFLGGFKNKGDILLAKISGLFNSLRARNRKLIIICLLVFMLFQVCSGILTSFATIVTHVTPSFMISDEDDHLKKLADKLIKQIDKIAEEDKEQLIARAIAEAERMVREDGYEGSLTRDMIRIDYMDMTGQRLMTTIPDSTDADGNVTYKQRSKYYADDPVPIQYKNVKQILAAVDICLTGYFDHDYKESEGIQFCKEVYLATHTGNFVINTHSYTDSEGNVHYVIDSANLTYMVNLSAADKYKGSDKEVEHIAGPIQVVNDSPRNTDKINFKSTEVLDIYQNIISMNWLELYEIDGYDFYNVRGEFVPDKLLDYADIVYRGFMTLEGVDTYVDPAYFTDGTLQFPVGGWWKFNGPRGMRLHPIQHVWKMHQGCDLGCKKGTPILAAEDGVITRAGISGSMTSGYGLLIEIDHRNGVRTRYGHNSVLLVKAGDPVTRGQQIALAGSTGGSTGPHCHFEVLVNGTNVDPEEWIGIDKTGRPLPRKDPAHEI